MDDRLYCKMSEALIESKDQGFGLYFHQYLDNMITPKLHRQLCEERYQALTDAAYEEAMFAPLFAESKSNRGDSGGQWPKRIPVTYSQAIDRFKEPTSLTKDTFKRFILCYATVGVIPVSQPVLGECVERFLDECGGGWVTKEYKHEDAMLYRLPGSFEGGKRR